MALTAAATALATDTTVVVTKTMHNIMDSGCLRFKVTLKKLATWGAANHAFVEFPSYYKPNVGEYLTCSWEDAKLVKKEDLYCEMRWDYSLKIWGPAAKAIALKDGAFHLRVSGVQFNDASAVKKFQVGF